MENAIFSWRGRGPTVEHHAIGQLRVEADIREGSMPVSIGIHANVEAGRKGGSENDYREQDREEDSCFHVSTFHVSGKA